MADLYFINAQEFSALRAKIEQIVNDSTPNFVFFNTEMNSTPFVPVTFHHDAVYCFGGGKAQSRTQPGPTTVNRYLKQESQSRKRTLKGMREVSNLFSFKSEHLELAVFT